MISARDKAVISAKSIAVVAMLALVGAAIAQEKVDERRIGELIEQLLRERPGAADALLTTGQPGIQMMVRRLEGGAAINQTVLDYLRRAGPEAAAAIVPLMTQLSEVEDSLIQELAWTLLALASYQSPEEKMEIELALATEARQRSDEAHDVLMDVQRIMGATKGFFVVGDVDGLRGIEQILFESPQYYAVGLLLALPRSDVTAEGVLAEDVLPLLHRLLTTGRENSAGMRTASDRAGNPRTVDLHAVIRRLAAEAIVELAPKSPEAGAAFGYLVQCKPNPAEALRAIVTLGQAGHATGAVPYLLEILEGDGDARLLAEVITALGMIGPSAKDAIPTLENLTEHRDPQIAERAKAALRQVRGVGAPRQAVEESK